MSVAGATDGLNDVYEALERYNWDDDVEFQSGLSAILGSNSTPEQAAELALRARCFYYARKYTTNIDFDAYKAYRNARGRPPPASASVLTLVPSTEAIPPAPIESAGGVLPAPASASEPPAPYPTTFAHIVDLITTGQPIPGIKDIPNTVLEGQGTQPEKTRRKKPWEKDEKSPATEESVPAAVS
ncbi:hypothetical protein P153DRAFT_292286 [Dothidotthia symphoricarpi CBS 119687]|uniref:Uncharacterized protein n=1 Tax=Dothidotthia symphoricarpi CBS 119687 TaxID=1392245 RepID=A0A6A6ADI8_9PLEO|nr:uncharacterized protein P153DRAFT_292286 [Dothidotthia symphoricarpi CBS 119687]KAF2128998.1 hypothetical protein P153DRAFT_292286 [Dothidotthia symphoricarpi CBS 119687]